MYPEPITYHDRRGKQLSWEEAIPLLAIPDYTLLCHDIVGDCEITTRWTGIDASGPGGFKSLYFETIARPWKGEVIPGAIYARRAGSEAEAWYQHHKAMRYVREGEPVLPRGL